jgi:hypothetical protein
MNLLSLLIDLLLMLHLGYLLQYPVVINVCCHMMIYAKYVMKTQVMLLPTQQPLLQQIVDRVQKAQITANVHK